MTNNVTDLWAKLSQDADRLADIAMSFALGAITPEFGDSRQLIRNDVADHFRVSSAGDYAEISELFAAWIALFDAEGHPPHFVEDLFDAMARAVSAGYPPEFARLYRDVLWTGLDIARRP